ncbi:hypothetical protein JL09_g1525 [Pichia kudriavzevii]|uniref:MINDY deubiquitinase domain-containing protein n=1 Tax=Pichia kudriavzevii TaxID=4909 RepID=A0A099P536_PICKU|nr:hypothetical protein JL09_g1525 [Pichia kudriavzevii]
MSTFQITVNSNLVPVLRQNENGPCYIIALVNAILLRDSQSQSQSQSVQDFVAKLTELEKSQKKVPIDEIYAFLVDSLLGMESLDPTEIMNTLPVLESGLLINPAFDDPVVTDFGLYSEAISAILSHFKVKLYHGFIMPYDLLDRLHENGIETTFDSCQDYLVSHIDHPDDDMALQISTFLSSEQTQLTESGLELLTQQLSDDEIAIFFRNDHYSTCTKHNNRIYLLVTDVGYINQRDIVWQPLALDNDTDFVNFSFERSRIVSPERIKDPKLQEQEEADLQLARQIQVQEDEHLSKRLQRDKNKHQQQSQGKISQKTPQKQELQPQQHQQTYSNKVQKTSNGKACSLKKSKKKSCIIV